MNKIFKVIWSKSKQCYVVVSEIAKNKTGKKKIVVASILAILAMAGTVNSVEAAIPEGTTSDPLGIAMGALSKSGSNQSIAIGYLSEAKGTNAASGGGNPGTAVGAGAKSIGAGTSAYGLSAYATADYATAIGKSANAAAINSIAIGKGASITAPIAGTTFGGQDSIAMGTGASAKQHSSVTIGPGSTSDGVRNITIGPKASASGVDSIAIGNGGVGGDKNNTGFGGNGNTYTINVNDISTNVYYGVKSVDNGSIAFGNRANAAKGGLAIGTVSIADGGIAVGQSVLSKNGVAIGSAVSATAANAVALGSRAEASSVGAVAIGGYSVTDKTKAQGNNALAIGASAVTNGNETIAIGKSANASNSNAVAVGKNANASIANSVAIGSDSTTDTNATRQANTTINGITYNFAGATSDAGMQVSVGAAGKERQIKNVAAGEVSATSTDAINGSQLFAVASQIKPQLKYVSIKSDTELDNANNDGATADKAIAIGPIAKASSKSAVAIGNTSTASSENAIAIGNNSNSSGVDSVAIGPSSVSNNVGSVAVGKDAKANGAFTVALGGGNWQSKGAQANGVGTIALGTYTRTKESTNYQTAVGFESKTDAESATAIGYKAVASGKDSVALGTGASTTGQDALTFGHNSQANGKSSLAMGLGAQANSNNAIALGYQTNSNSTNSTNGVFIGSVAGKETNGVGNIGIGSNTGNKIIGDNNVSIGTGAGSVTATNVYASESIMLGTQARAINSTAANPVTNVIAIGKGSSGGSNSTIAIGQNASSTNQNSIAIGTNASAPAYNGVAIGSFSVANTEGGTVEGYNANASRTDKYAGLAGAVLKGNLGAVSIGNGGTMTRQIKNLAAGTADTDAVNVAQLKSVNLAFKGNTGVGGDVNLATNPLTIKGNDSYITTNASGNTITISANQKDIHVISGTANADTGVANAKNVATAINDAISQNKYKWYLTADNDTAGSRATIDKEGTVKFSGDPNITVARSGNTITSSLNKIITVDTVKASKSVIAGSGNDQITLDGTSGTVKGKTFSGQSFAAGNNVLSNTTLQIGSATNGDNNVTISRDGFSSKAGTKTVKFGATGIDVGGQVITNVSSGGNVGTNAANITDVKNYVGKVALNIQSNSKTGTINLEQGALGVTGANGIRTDLSGTGNSNLVIGLDKNTINATTNGIGLSSDSGTMLRKFLKDGHADFKISGDGGLVITSGTTTGVQVSVDKSKVKDLAVEAVTVSKANTVDNPITVTPTTGSNSKEYAIGIDTSKLAAKTEVTYRANNAADANAKKVSLSKGFNFVDGGSTVATVDNDGKVSFDLNTATKNQINTNTTDIAANTTALARNISLGADTGTASRQSLSTADVAFNVKGSTGDFVSTNMNGNTVEISTTRATINSDANTGAASVTGNDGIATAKNVADAINKAADAAKAGSAWNVSTNGDTSTKVSGGDTVDFTGDNNITVDRNNKTISTSLNKNLTDMNSISLGNARGETIFLNGRDGSIKAGKAEFKDNVGAGSTITSDQLSFTNGATGANESTTTIALDTVAIQSGPNSSILTSKDLTFSDEDGNNAEGSAKGMAFQDAAGKMVHFSLDEIKAGGNKIQEVAEGTADTDAVNVKQLKDTVASQTLTYRANTAADADAKSVKLSKGLDFVDGTSTVATVDNDGKVSFDLNTATKNQINTNTTDITTNKGKIATNTTNIAANTTALARNISLGADTGTASNQSLSTSDVAFNVKGATGDFVSTNMNGNTVEISTKRATINSNATTGEASVTGNDGLATAQNVADAINKAADAAKAGAAWNITTNSSTTDKTAVKGGDTVDLINGDNIEITQDGTDKKKITVATKKDITVDSVTANNKVTVGSGANAITLNGADGSVTGKAFTGTTFTGTSFTAGNTVINTSGLTNGTTAITGTGITTDKLTVGGISVDKTDGINAGGKVISNVASGGTTDSNAANIGDVKQAVANLSQNLNITDGTNNGTIDLKNQKLNVAGANGVTTTVKDQTITVGLDANTVNATTKGIGLTGDTGSTGNKYLKDGDVSFAVTGDGSLVSTTATAAGVKVAVNSASITAGADGTITGPTTDGVATAKNVADAINAAKKASKTEITANTGEAANATTGNMTLTSTTAADGHTIYDVKLNNKVTLGTGANAVTIDGTTGAITGKTATIGGVTVNGTANTIGGLSNTTWNGTAVSGRAATEDQLKAATGATTLKFTGDVATNTGSVNLKDDTFGIKGDGKYISTDVNGKNVKLTVSEAEVKKSAVAAVTVSTDTTDANNPLTVTPTTSADGTTKDYKVTIDGTKIANKTNLSYKANGGTAKQVSLADGLNFKNGTLTTASIDDNGVVKYDVNTASITAGADGTITGPTTDGVATAQNVADAINAAKKASKTEITANTGEAANATTGNVTLTSTTAADGHTIYDVKLNDKVTLGSGTNAVTVDGTAAKVTAGVTTVDGATGTITTGGTNSIKVDGVTGTVTGLTNKDWTPGVTKAVTGRAATEDQLQKVADAASSQTWNITADKAGTTGAQTGTKKNATVGKDETVELVAGDNLTINQNERKFTYSLNKDLAGLTSVSIGTGTTETIKLDGATGKITAKNAAIGGVTVDGDNNHVTGLANTTWNGTATTGRAATEDQLKAVADTAKTTTDAVNLKFAGDTNTSPGVVNLKDDTLGIVGDGKYVSTDANGKNLTVKVSEAEIKKSAVAAVTVSTDTTDANNPLTVTPTTSADGTTKDYKVTIDGTKIANKTNLSYKANDGTAKQVSLADGLNFKNGTLTTASIDDNGVVKYDVNTASITAGADGTITGPTTDGVATAQNVADAINAAKKASKTEITANTGEAANATTGNVTLTSTTAADGHTIYDVKLNDKVTLGSGANAVTIDGTAGKATIGSSVINGVNNTFTTGGAKAVTLDGATGTITGTTANIGGVTVNGTANTIGGLSNTTWNGTATTGRAATEDQLKAVADAAGSQTWEITADKKAGTSGAQTGTKENAKVGKDDKVSLIAGENLTVDQAGKNFTYSLNKDLVKMNSATFLGTGTNTTVITGDSITQTAGTQTNTSTAGGNTVADGTKSTGTTAAGQVIKDGAKSNKSTVDSNVVDDGNGNVNTSNATSNTITDGTNRSSITAGKATIGSSVINGVNNTFTTGGANAVKLDGAAGTIKTGTVTVTGGTTNDITGLSNTTVTSADFATKGRAATEEQLKAVGEQTWQITADKDTATSGAQTGTKKDAKVGKDDKVQLIAGENMAVNQNERDFTFTLNKDLVKMNSATFLGTGTNTTVITGDSITQTAGTQTNTSTAAGNTVADGTKSTETTADGQVIKDGAKSNKSTVDNNVIDDGNGNVNTSNATSNTITDGTNTTATTSSSVTVKDNAGNSTVITKDNITTGVGGNKITFDGTAGKATVGASIVDGVNNTFTTGGANAVKLDGVAGTIKTGTVTVTGGTTNDITGLSNTTVNSADFATKGRAATEEQLKAVGEQTWQITADKDATTSGAQTGTKKDAKVGKDDKVQLIAGENMTVNQNERDFTFTLNKDLVKMNSATFLGTGTNKTVITGDSITQTAGTQTNTSTAGGNTVADGTKSIETTAAGQVIKDGTKTNTSTVDENTIVDGTKSNKSTVDGNTITDGTNTTETTSSSVTVKDNAGNSTVITKDNITTGVGANKVTLDGTAGKATIGSSVVDGVNNTFTTGGANAVKLDGAAGTIKTGTVTVTGGTTNDITGLSNTTVTAADFAMKGRAATEEQLKAVGEQTWQITADKDATTSGAQTGTKKDAKVGKDDKVQLIAGENMTVNQNERDFTFTLNKDLVKMNSATFEATGGKTTVIKGDSIVQTDGTKVNTSTAGGNTVADGTKSTETTADGQVIKDGAKSNKSTVDSNVIDDGTGNVNTSNATSNTVTDGTNTTATTSSSVTVKDNAGNSTVITKDNITTGVGGNKITFDGTAGKATVGASIVDGVNNTFTTGGANAVKLDGVAGTIKTGTVTVTGGTTNDITGLSNTTVNSADFATKGRAATEEQLKAVGEQTWQITADKDATTSGAQTGTKKDAKVGKDDKVQLIAGENITVNQNERDFTFTLNKDLVKMNSATFLGTGTNKTVITGDSITQTAGTQTNTSTAGGNTVADGTKSTETTAAGQVIKDGAKSNKSTVDNNVIDDGNGNVNTSNATSNTITDGTNTTATTSSSVTVKDNAGNSTVITKDNITTGVGGNKITFDGTAGKATVGASIVDGVNNTFTTGGANAVKLDGVAGTIKTGTVTVTGGTTNDITGLSNTTVNSADFATKGRAATEEQLKAVGEQTWQITADKDATTSGAQTGTKKDAKVGKDDKVQLIAGENITVNQNERDFTFTLNKDLVKMNSATFLGTGSNTTVITGNSITQTAGTQTNTSTAGGNTVADGTKSTETTAAGQVIKDGAKSNKSTVDSNVIDDGNGNVNTSNATSNTITDGTNTSTITAGKANIGNIAVDGVNNKITMGNGANPVTLDGANGHLDGLTNTTWVPGVTKATTGRAATEDQLQQVSDAVGAGWKVNTGIVAGSSGVSNGAASTKVSSGEEVKLQAGDNLVIDQNGKTVSYSLNKDLTKMNSATFEATGGKTTVIKGDSIVQTDGGKTNTSNAAGNTVVDGNKSTATTAAGTTITDGAKTNTSTADKNVINDGAGNTNTATATSNNLADNAGNSNVSNATSNTLKNAAGDETKADAKGVTVKDAAGNNATFTKDGITITKTGKDTVSLTSDGLDNGKNKIVNVAAGVTNTDAVNVGQLKEYAAKSTTELTANNGETAGSTTGNIVLTKTTAADGHTIYDNKLNDKITLGSDPTKAVTVDGTTGMVTGLTNKTWTPGSIVSGRAATEDQLKEAVADSGWKAAVDKEGSGQSTVVGTSPEKIKAEETVTFKAGNNMMVTQTGKSISYAVNPELTNMTSATFKDAAGNTTVTNGNGITITPGSANPTNPHAGPVSLTKDGLNNGNNQIKGVAPGTDPTDAVNVSQLNTSNANTSQAINQIAGEVQHVGAHAAAMAALKPIQYDPLEPTQVMAGVGNYRGETAAALGLAHYTNENTMFNVGVSVGGNHNMVNAGVTHKFGYSPEKKNIPDRYKAGPISSVYVMQDEVSSLKKENAEQKYVIADQAARLTTLEAENEQQRRELAETKKGLDDLKAAVDKLLASKG